MAVIDKLKNLHRGRTKEEGFALSLAEVDEILSIYEAKADHSFVIKRFYEDGSSQYYWGINEGINIFVGNINLALEFASYEHAMEHIKIIDKGIYMIGKVISN